MRKKGGARRRLSLKLKLTLWFAACMAGIAALCLGFVLLMSGRVSRSEAYNLLDVTVRGNLSDVSLSEDGKVELGADFGFYKNGVYLLLYHKNGSLLSGQVPPGFPVREELENGVKRAVSGEAGSFYVFDLWIPSGWENGLWLRGVVQQADTNQETAGIIAMFGLIFPFVILSAALGGYMIARRAMEPIEQVIGAADSISEGKDLSRRIEAPEGTDEAGRLAGAFNRMFARLEDSFEAEKQFASDASHELRTPTAVILAQCGYLKKYAETPEEYREGVEVIDRQGQRMSRLIDRLLDMTRLEFGTRKPNFSRMDFSQMTAVICEERDTMERGISIETKIEPDVIVRADPDLLSRVVGNLLDNARKYGKDGGHILVCLREDGENAVLTVEDDGIGISAEHLDKIWKRFYQVKSSREDGAGLGLSMVKQIMELHGGSVGVESVPGEGSRFIVTLKRASLEEAEENKALNIAGGE